MELVLFHEKATDYERFVMNYIAFSESDMFNDRSQVMEDGVHRTWGMFQMSDRWWGTKDQILDIEYSTVDRLEQLRKRKLTGDPTIDAWFIQGWSVTNPFTFNDKFWAAPETQNYTSRLGKIRDIMADGLYFTNHPDEHTQLVEY